MRTKKEGGNTFSNYDAVKFFIDHTSQKKTCKSLQITWGGYAEFDPATMRNDIANYNINIRRYFKSKVRDGYFTDRFIYINDKNEKLMETARGLWFPKMFLFLEDEMDKKFVVEYLETLFADLADYHENHKTIKFTHYELRNGNKDNTSI